MMDASPDELRVFLEEAREQIELLDRDLIRLERESDDGELLQEIFRAAHTLKGSSSMLGLSQMANLTHEMEGVLDCVRKGALAVTPPLIDGLLAGLDALKQMKDQLGDNSAEGVAIDAIVSALQQASAAPAGNREGVISTVEGVLQSNEEASQRLAACLAEAYTAWTLDVQIDGASQWASVRLFQVLQELADGATVVCSVPSIDEIEAGFETFRLQAIVCTNLEMESVIARVRAVDEVRRVEYAPRSGEPTHMNRLVPSGLDAPTPVASASQPEATARTEVMQSVRIDIAQLDHMMNLVGELSVDRTRMSLISRTLQARYKEDDLTRALAETSSHIVKIVDELHTRMTRVRMLPVGLLFGKFPRLVRDVARATGREVDLDMEGEDTEIDRSVIERIKDPIVHLVRNAVDHGIESADVRLKAGKPAAGRLRLSAEHEQGQIVIRLEDDGQGIDAERIRDLAIERGVISGEAGARLTPSQCVDLIFEPGFSTAEVTTEISGRGVGMDIVRRDIGALNGTIQVQTQPGVGTSFTLRLPLTLATIRSLIVSAAGTLFAIPLTFVQEAMFLDPSALHLIGGRSVVSLRGAVMPVVDLARLWNNDSEHVEQPCVVIAQAGSNRAAIAVEALVDQQEIVVKPLGPAFAGTRGVVGASIGPDGQVMLVLDVLGVLQSSGENLLRTTPVAA